MTIELLIIGTLFGVCLALSAKALYHRNRALRMLDELEGQVYQLQAEVGLTTRYKREQTTPDFGPN